jgi:hypothetical protein
MIDHRDSDLLESQWTCNITTSMKIWDSLLFRQPERGFLHSTWSMESGRIAAA